MPKGISLFLINLQILEKFDLNSIEDRMYLYLHWSLNFSKKFGEWKLRKKDIKVLNSIVIKQSKNNSELSAIRLPFFLTSIHRTRSDINNAFNLKTLDGSLNFLKWWKNSYRHEVKLISYPIDIKLKNIILYPWSSFSFNKANISYLYKPWSKHKVIPHFLGSIWESREDLKNLYDAYSDIGVISLINWWTKDGLKDYPLFSWDANKANISYLYKPWNKNKAIPHFLGSIWESREDLKNLYDAYSDIGVISLINWWEMHGRFEYQGLELEKC